MYFTGRYSYYDEYREQRLNWGETNELHTIEDWVTEIEPHFYGDAVAAPTYIEVWLWLWREKKVTIEIFADNKCGWFFSIDTHVEIKSHTDPEDAIIEAIECLVDNNLIK